MDLSPLVTVPTAPDKAPGLAEDVLTVLVLLVCVMVRCTDGVVVMVSTVYLWRRLLLPSCGLLSRSDVSD